MKYHPNQVYHVFNQGNNRQLIFSEEENYYYFLRKVKRYILPFADILCYCLMPNHFHLLIVPNEEASQDSKAIKPFNKSLINEDMIDKKLIDTQQEKLSQAVGTLLSSYTKAYNKRNGRSGSLFRQKTKVKDVRNDSIMINNILEKQLLTVPENLYAKNCFKYIHQNPVKAGLVSNPIDWAHSSALDYAYPQLESFCNREMALELNLWSSP